MKPKCCGNCIFQHPPMSLQFVKTDKIIGVCEIKGVVELDNKDVCWHYFDGSKEMQEREAYIALCPHMTYDWHCKVDYGRCMDDCKRMQKYDKEHGNIS